MDLEQIIAIVKTSTTDDGRIAPDYTDSYVLKRAIDELLEIAYIYEGLSK